MADGTTVRLAFRIGYLGDAYHGSQIQPDVKTVQGELIRVFRSLKWPFWIPNGYENERVRK